jgi:hypothetical protein
MTSIRTSRCRILHQALTEACRTRAAAADEADRASDRHLEDPALPRLTPKVPAQEDRGVRQRILALL